MSYIYHAICHQQFQYLEASKCITYPSLITISFILSDSGGSFSVGYPTENPRAYIYYFLSVIFYTDYDMIPVCSKQNFETIEQLKRT